MYFIPRLQETRRFQPPLSFFTRVLMPLPDVAELQTVNIFLKERKRFFLKCGRQVNKVFPYDSAYRQVAVG